MLQTLSSICSKTAGFLGHSAVCTAFTVCATFGLVSPTKAEIQGGLSLTSDCGAVGDGRTDDSAALERCVEKLKRTFLEGKRTFIHAPAGYYLIRYNKYETGMFRGVPGSIFGDGPRMTFFIIPESFDGDLFSWNEAWSANNVSTQYDPKNDKSGPIIKDITIVGSRKSAYQNGLVFYGRNDNLLIDNVEVINSPGYCLALGVSNVEAPSYAREGVIRNLKCWGDGRHDRSAVLVTSNTYRFSDATNELDFEKLSVQGSYGDGLTISNPNSFSATRRIRFFGLRVEESKGDGISIGAAGDKGQVANLAFYGLDIVNTSGIALAIGKGKEAPPPYAIEVFGDTIGPGNHTSINVEKGRLILIKLTHVDGVVLMSHSAGSAINISGSGDERNWNVQDLR